MKFNKIYDISIILDDKTVYYPDDSKFNLNWRRKIINNDAVNVSELKISSHNGTHIDSPFHFYDNGKKIDDFLAKNGNKIADELIRTYYLDKSYFILLEKTIFNEDISKIIDKKKLIKRELIKICAWFCMRAVLSQAVMTVLKSG